MQEFKKMNFEEIIDSSEIVYRACQRIDFGGTTDLREVVNILDGGGACFNMGVSLYAYACFFPDKTLKFPKIVSLDLNAESVIEDKLKFEDITNDDPLKLLKALAVKSNFHFPGKIVTFSNPSFVGTGLGASGSVGIAFVGLLNNLCNLNISCDNLVKLCFDTETFPKEKGGLGITGGSQDQYAAAYGGFNLWRFYPDKTERKTIPRYVIEEKYLSERLILCYCGKSHYSGESNKLMLDNIISGKKDTVNAIYAIRDLSADFFNAMYFKKYEKLPKLMMLETENRKFLHPIAVEGKDGSYKKFMECALNAGATGAKVMGAGGGGTWAFWVEPQYKEAVCNSLKNMGGKILDYTFDFEGLKRIK